MFYSKEKEILELLHVYFMQFLHFMRASNKFSLYVNYYLYVFSIKVYMYSTLCNTLLCLTE